MQDILLDDDLDLAVSADGDFPVGESTYQEVKILLLAHKGELLHAPHLGVGLSSYLKSAGQEEKFKAEVQTTLRADSLTVREIQVVNLATGEVNIGAEREV